MSAENKHINLPVKLLGRRHCMLIIMSNNIQLYKGMFLYAELMYRERLPLCFTPVIFAHAYEKFASVTYYLGYCDAMFSFSQSVIEK